jgi:hypothetical protein
MRTSNQSSDLADKITHPSIDCGGASSIGKQKPNIIITEAKSDVLTEEDILSIVEIEYNPKVRE